MRRTQLAVCLAAICVAAGHAQSPTPEDLVKQGRALVSQGNLADPFIANLLGMAYEAKGDLANARQYYRRTLELNAHSLQNAFARPHARARLAPASQ